jgi:prepilin-type N-terminal cleavage/methylation domain-containing protein
MKKDKGFSLVEIIIVIVIVGILSMISVPIYRGHVARSIATEGRALVHEAAAAQEIYRARSQSWFTGVTSSTNVISELGLDSRRNQYFNKFQYTMNSDTEFSVKSEGDSNTKGSGITVELKWTAIDPAVVTVKDSSGNEI